MNQAGVKIAGLNLPSKTTHTPLISGSIRMLPVFSLTVGAMRGYLATIYDFSPPRFNIKSIRTETAKKLAMAKSE